MDKPLGIYGRRHLWPPNPDGPTCGPDTCVFQRAAPQVVLSTARPAFGDCSPCVALLSLLFTRVAPLTPHGI